MTYDCILGSAAIAGEMVGSVVRRYRPCMTAKVPTVLVYLWSTKRSSLGLQAGLDRDYALSRFLL